MLSGRKILQKLGVPALVLASIALFVLSMPRFSFSGFAWFFCVPLAVWSLKRPAWKRWLPATWAFCYLSGVLILIWLSRLYPPLGWIAVFLLPVIYTAFPFAWFVALRKIFPLCTRERSVGFRVLCMLGLSGLWIVLEWVLTWFLTGFPWMPLGATQWNFPAVLSLCKFAGTPAASAMVVFFNLAVARYIWKQFVEMRRPCARASSADPISVCAAPLPKFFRSFCPEFYIALAPIFVSIVMFAYSCFNYENEAEKKFSFAAVQTNFDPMEKWDKTRFSENLDVLKTLTLAAPLLGDDKPQMTLLQAKSALAENAFSRDKNRVGNNAERSRERSLDFILWPEAAMPVLQLGDKENGYEEFLAGLSRAAKTPIVAGAIYAAKTPANPDGYYNSVHVIDPKFGLGENFAAKRHLVPFGEYVPLADILPLRKVVPVATDCLRGTSFEPLCVRSRKNSVLKLGVLVCYEDVFPELGRAVVNAGADTIAVVTNDAWYGEGSGAYQHMAHSVMQAVSLGVPVIRCGNAGWSGVISPIGQIYEMADARGSIYFRGVRRFDVYGKRDAEPTFYALHGDWLVLAGGAFFALALAASLRECKREKIRPASGVM
ncbi:MAG: apolipoprotein N-acyltransferase [Opitutae bacterium]|nr:apolipoprotein N-acyltransferase [Opitutae bacterium]MCD8298559.1 apolipoprotein N-acyltransferase [Opitutae bacterium]